MIEPKFAAYKALCKERYLMSPKDYKNRDTLRGDLNVMFRENGLYVVAKYPQEQQKQVSSHYEPVRSKRTSGDPNTPTSVNAALGDRQGEVRGSTIARGYNLKYRIKSSDDAWLYKSVPKSRGVVIEGLEPAELYEFWVQAIGAKKDSDYGGPAEARAK